MQLKENEPLQNRNIRVKATCNAAMTAFAILDVGRVVAIRTKLNGPLYNHTLSARRLIGDSLAQHHERIRLRDGS